MNSKKLNFLSNIYFGLILALGASYLVFLAYAFTKIFPGFAMQLIFFIDSLKFRHDLYTLITSQVFLVNFVPGLLLTTLFAKLAKSIFSLIKNVRQTISLTNNLKFVRQSQSHLEFRSSQASIFTLGFIKPKIYLSSEILKTHTKLEIKSMLQHEINHQQNHHPLKVFISNFIKSFTPTIPGKTWLFDSYLTSTEVSSDIFSEEKIKSKSPLVSSLLKFNNQSFESLPASISYFNSQSERIKILVGQKKPLQHISMIYSTLVVAVIMVSALSVKNTNLFYECQHLASCLTTLISPNGQSLTPSTSSTKSSTFSSDHCQ